MSADPVDALATESVLWSAGHVSAADIVRAACDVLAAGHGGMSLATLAGIPLRFADDEAPELIPEALAEVGLPYFPRGSAEGRVAALKVMAARMIAGVITSRELTEWAHSVIGHDGPEIGLALVSLQDHYQLAENVDGYYVSGEHLPTLDAEVMEEARRLVSLDSASPR